MRAIHTASPIRDRLAECVIGAAIVSAAWWTLARPAHEKEYDASARIESAQADLALAESSDAPDPVRLAADHQQILAWTADIADPLGAGARIQRAADAAGARIDRLMPAQETESAPRGRLTTSTRRFEVVASGTAQSLGALADRIAQIPLTTVRSFEIAPGPTADEVIAVVIIDAIGIAIADHPGTEDEQ